VQQTRKCSKETELVQEAYKSGVTNTPTVFRWWQHLKEGNKKVVDDA
jgi:hypothetical protein